MSSDNGDDSLLRLVDLYQLIVNCDGDEADISKVLMTGSDANSELCIYLDSLYSECCSLELRSEPCEPASKEDLEQIEADLLEQLELLAEAKHNRLNLADCEAKIVQRQKEIASKVKELEKTRSKAGRTAVEDCENAHQITDLVRRIEQLRRKNEQVELMAKRKAEMDQVCDDLQKQINCKIKEKTKLSRDIKHHEASRSKLTHQFERRVQSMRAKLCQQKIKLGKLETANRLKARRINDRQTELIKLTTNLHQFEENDKLSLSKKVTEFNEKFEADVSLRCEYDRCFGDWTKRLSLVKPKRKVCSNLNHPFLTSDPLTAKPFSVYDEKEAAEMNALPWLPSLMREFNRRMVKTAFQGQVIFKHCCMKMGALRDWTASPSYADSGGEMASVQMSIDECRRRIAITERIKQVQHDRYEYLIASCGRRMRDIVQRNRPLFEKMVKLLLNRVMDDFDASCSFRTMLQQMGIELFRRPSLRRLSLDSASQTHLFLYPRTPSGERKALQPRGCSQDRSSIQIDDHQLSQETVAISITPMYHLGMKRHLSWMEDQENLLNDSLQIDKQRKEAKTG